MSKTYAIIVTYNPDLPILQSQILAVRDSVGIIVIDNFSGNVTKIAEMVAGLDVQDLHFLRNESNVGLATAQNQGINKARSLGTTHVIIFDQDSIPEPRMIETLLEAEAKLLANGEKVGAVGPLTYDPLTSVEYPITKYRGPVIQRYHPQPGEITDATFIIASGSLLRMSVLDEVGAMLDKLFIDYIDVEWCYRAQARGYKIFVSADARMSHMVGDQRVKFFGRSISQHSPLRRYYLTRNSFLVLRLPHIPVGYKIREVTLNFARFVAFFYFSNERMKYLKYIRKAMHDGICGNFGKIQGMQDL
jgi:rhamnosyltransferase